MRDCHDKTLYLGTFPFTCLFMSICGCYGYVYFVFTLYGGAQVCAWTRGCEDGQARGMYVQVRTGYQALSSLPLHFERSVSGLSALPTKLSPGAFAFPLPELSHALLDMITKSVKIKSQIESYPPYPTPWEK